MPEVLIQADFAVNPATVTCELLGLSGHTLTNETHKLISWFIYKHILTACIISKSSSTGDCHDNSTDR